MKVLVQAPLSPYSGYGNDGIGIVRALMRAGADVYVNPTSAQPPWPKDIIHLMGKRLTNKYDLLINHVDPAQLGVTLEARQAAHCVLGWTMWEYSSLDNMQYKDKRSLRKRLKDFDYLLGYDDVTESAFDPYWSKDHELDNCMALQGGFWPDQWPKSEVRDWFEEPFRFCMVGQLHERKDPWVAIAAFRNLKQKHGDDFKAELHLKTNVAGLHPQMEQWIPGIRIHYAVWEESLLKEFYDKCHVLLAPSRGEGKNMPALEFMSTGGTVIATDWGGHTQWLEDSYSYPLDYVLRSIDEKHPNCLNARASEQHLEELMWHCYTNRAECRIKGDLASKVIPATCSWDKVIERLFTRLEASSPGSDIYTLSRMMHGDRQS